MKIEVELSRDTESGQEILLSIKLQDPEREIWIQEDDLLCALGSPIRESE